MRRLALFAALALLHAARADDASLPHTHQGVFKKYKPGPPKSAGLQLSAARMKRLRENVGKPEYTIDSMPTSKSTPKGTMRCTSVQDVRAPPAIVWSLLTDYPNYPKFISGLSSCKPYMQRRTMTGGKVVGARYAVSLGPTFKIAYYLEHQYEPLQNCMVWHMDYSKRSDLFDSVGYWFVEAQPWGSRVYYTTQSMLPAWIPGPIRKTFIKVTMRACTKTLEPSCIERMRRQKRGKFGLPALPSMPQMKLPSLRPASY